MSENKHTPESTCPSALPFMITDQEMKDLIKEVALYVGREMFDCERPADAAFFEACLIELSNRAEAVVCWKDSEARNRVIFPPMKPEAGDDGWLPLFTFPPIHDIEANCVPQWQPIETAPNKEAVLAARFDGGMFCWATDAKKSNVGFWSTLNGRAVNTPTHWMPLPSAPAPKEES